MKDYTPKEQIFLWWLERGFSLLPCYTNSKYVLPGWGKYQKKINTLEDANRLIGQGGNFAVVCPDDILGLDFDVIGIHNAWAEDNPTIAKTYTEKTPRDGRHVFVKCSRPQGIKLKKGVEIKHTVIASPSKTATGIYQRGEGEILSASTDQVFFSLSEPGTPSAYVLGMPRRARRLTRTNDGGAVARIKQHWNCLDVFGIYKPQLKFSVQRGYAVGLCPWHDDHKPSLFIVLDKDFFKCHACGVSGDVINLYARFEGITNTQAIERMSAVLEMSR